MPLQFQGVWCALLVYIDTRNTCGALSYMQANITHKTKLNSVYVKAGKDRHNIRLFTPTEVSRGKYIWHTFWGVSNHWYRHTPTFHGIMLAMKEGKGRSYFEFHNYLVPRFLLMWQTSKNPSHWRPCLSSSGETAFRSILIIYIYVSVWVYAGVPGGQKKVSDLELQAVVSPGCWEPNPGLWKITKSPDLRQLPSSF